MQFFQETLPGTGSLRKIQCKSSNWKTCIIRFMVYD
jgi:hypothetical protein